MSSDSVSSAKDGSSRSVGKVSRSTKNSSDALVAPVPLSETSSAKLWSSGSLDDQIRSILEAEDSPRDELRAEELAAAREAVAPSNPVVASSTAPNTDLLQHSTSASSVSTQGHARSASGEQATRQRSISRRGASRRLEFTMTDENVVADAGSDTSWFVEQPSCAYICRQFTLF